MLRSEIENVTKMRYTLSVSYLGIGSMYRKVSGILVGTSVGVFVGKLITTSQQSGVYDKYLVGWLWRCFILCLEQYNISTNILQRNIHIIIISSKVTQALGTIPSSKQPTKQQL